MKNKGLSKNNREGGLARTLALLVTAKAVIILVVVGIILLMRWALT